MKNSKLQFFRTRFLVLFLLVSSYLSSQELYYDVNPGKEGSNPVTFVKGDSSFVFSANGAGYGFELFESNGTASGTSIFEDLAPGAASGNLYQYIVIDNVAYYLQNSFTGAVNLWKHPLNAPARELITSIPTNYAEGFFIQVPEKIGNNIFFCFRNSNAVLELWKTDGTANNTSFVQILGVNASPDNFQILDNILYFFSDNGFDGRELWRSDGTTQGTYLVEAVTQNNNAFTPVFNLTVFKGKLYFIAIQPQIKYEMWVSDGTANGTSLFMENQPSEIQVAGENMFFLGSDPVEGTQLWKYDGSNPPELVKDLPDQVTGALTTSGNRIYFYQSDASEKKTLWTSDGTASGTFLLKDINPFPYAINNEKINGATVNGVFYFAAGDGVSGSELWATDGTTAGTVLVKDIASGDQSSAPKNFINFNNQIFFSATDGQSGRELFTTDGTSAGTGIVKALNETGASSIPQFPAVFQDKLYFVARTPEIGAELWGTDGNAQSTQLIKDFYPGPTDGYPFFKCALNSEMIFLSDHPEYGQEMWTSDGTTIGTQLLKDIGQGTFGAGVKTSTSLGDKFVFGAFTPNEGEEPWVSDGTENGTNIIVDLSPELFAQSFPTFNATAFVFNGKKHSIFEALSANNQLSTLYITDGTAAGTVALTNTYPGGAFYVLDLVQLNNIVLFGNFSTGLGQLWKTDGTPAGTELVKQFSGYGLGKFCKLKNAVYFVAPNNNGGSALWKTDGTASGTEMVYDLTPSGGSASIFDIKNVNDDLVFFSLYSSINNNFELWVTDGTNAGTHLVKDINPNPNGSQPFNLTPLYDKIYFSADDGVNGRELWVSDGTEAGTYMLKDIWEGPASGEPEYMIVFDDHIYFGANDGIHGKELWRYPEGNSSTQTPENEPPLDIYPNPSDESCILNFEKAGQWLVNVVNLQGVTVASQTINGKIGNLNTARLASGMYFINGVNQEDQQRMSSGKLMITHK